MNGKLQPFGRAAPMLESLDRFIDRQLHRGVPIETAMRAYDKMRSNEIWKNDEYQVSIDKNMWHGFGDEVVCWHLSIKRLDQKPIHDWRDLQAIKSALVGPKHEAVEMYPSEDRVMDVANQFHLYAFLGKNGEPVMFPLGVFDQREVSGPKEAKIVGAKQRALST